MRKWLAIAGALVILFAGGAVAYASIPGPDGVIHGCYKTGNPATGSVIVIDSEASCPSGFTALNWSQTGPQGPAGPPGSLSARTIFDERPGGEPCGGCPYVPIVLICAAGEIANSPVVLIYNGTFGIDSGSTNSEGVNAILPITVTNQVINDGTPPQGYRFQGSRVNAPYMHRAYVTCVHS